MGPKYQELACQESDLIRQLNQIDSLLPDDYRQDYEAYPQLFKDDDSLFKPDCVFNNNQQLLKQSQKNILKNNQNTFSKDNQDIFEEYLDTLEINEFIKIQSNQENYLGISNIHKNHNKQINSLECTFKPSISKKSNQLAGHLGPSFQRLTTSSSSHHLKKKPYQPNQKQSKKHYSRERIQRLSKPRILKTQPSQVIEKKPEQRSYKNNNYSRMRMRDPNYMDVAARNTLWQQQKKEKLQKLRKQQEQIRLKKQASSFKPKITSYKGEKQAQISDFGKEGIANYFERVSQATKYKNNKYINNTNNRETSPYSSRQNLSKTPKKQNTISHNRNSNQSRNIAARKSTNTQMKYQEAVSELHKKLMSLEI